MVIAQRAFAMGYHAGHNDTIDGCFLYCKQGTEEKAVETINNENIDNWELVSSKSRLNMSKENEKDQTIEAPISELFKRGVADCYCCDLKGNCLSCGGSGKLLDIYGNEGMCLTCNGRGR